MDVKRTSPRRAVNSVVHFNLEQFNEKLFRVLDPNDSTGYRTTGGKPGGFDISPDWLSSGPSIFGVNYLAAEIMSKFDDGEPSPTKTRTTYEKFMEAEMACRKTNERIRSRGFSFNTKLNVHSVLYTAERKISEVLGEFDREEARGGYDFGPGATFSLPRTRSDATYKFDNYVVTTIGNLGEALECISSSPLWQERVSSHSHVQLTAGNKVCTVPKNFKQDRVICVEPDMNIFVQKGIGAMIRRRLKRIGIDLNSQKENQDMARLGSMLDNLATIDLSMASDTISYEIVRQLIRPDWFEALEQCRSPVGFLPSRDGTRKGIIFEKFSSMGNGYTFELETLIFWGLCSAVIELLGLEDRRLAVYGDDIIVSADAAPHVIQILEWCGFKTNSKKTFLSGHFRESCGKHFYDGYDVTPFYIRRPVCNLLDLFLLHNNVYRYLDRFVWSGIWSRPGAYELLAWIRSHAPASWRKPRLPDGYGDGAFIGTFDQITPRRAPHGLEGFEVEVIVDTCLVRESELAGRLLKSLFKLERRKNISPLEAVEWSGGISQPPRARIKRILVQQCAGLHPCEGGSGDGDLLFDFLPNCFTKRNDRGVLAVDPLSIEWELWPYSFINPFADRYIDREFGET